MNTRALLKALMERSGDNPNSLAAKLNQATKQPQIHRFITGEAKEPRRSTLQPVADHYKVNIEAFYDDELARELLDMIEQGKPLPTFARASAPSPLARFGPPVATTGVPGAFVTNPSTAKKVWVVGKGQGGMPERIWTDGDHPIGITDEFAEVHSTDPHAFLVRVEGSSMYPKFEDGNFVLVEPGTEPELEDCVLVRLNSGHTLIKRLLSRRHGYRLGSFNDPQVLEYPREDVTWCYYVAHEVPRRKIKSRH